MLLLFRNYRRRVARRSCKLFQPIGIAVPSARQPCSYIANTSMHCMPYTAGPSANVGHSAHRLFFIRSARCQYCTHKTRDRNSADTARDVVARRSNVETQKLATGSTASLISRMYGKNIIENRQQFYMFFFSLLTCLCTMFCSENNQKPH